MNGLQILPSYKDYFHLNVATTGLNNAAAWMGSILCTPFTQLLPDKLGRRKAILASALICCVGIVLQSAAQNIGMFVVGRIIIGLGSALSSGAALLYWASYSPPSLVDEFWGSSSPASTWGVWRPPSSIMGAKTSNLLGLGDCRPSFNSSRVCWPSVSCLLFPKAQGGSSRKGSMSTPSRS
jgi:MFS family permease